MTDLRLLGFGSSARRSFTPWTSPAPWAALLRAARPTHVGHGASPSGGGDAVIDEVSRTYYHKLGLDPDEQVLPFPMYRPLDGAGNGAFMARNGRMLKTFRPHVAAGLVVGRVGQAIGTRGCYLSNGSDDMAQRLWAARVPLVIYREDGVEPCRALADALGMLRVLFYECGRDPALIAPGKALKSWIERGGNTFDELHEMLTALACAREASRLGPWLAPIEATLLQQNERETPCAELRRDPPCTG